MRKTIEVEKIVKMANAYLTDKNTTAEGRSGVIDMLEAVLFETERYAGFSYEKAGYEYGDLTRRLYYYK